MESEDVCNSVRASVLFSAGVVLMWLTLVSFRLLPISDRAYTLLLLGLPGIYLFIEGLDVFDRLSEVIQ